MLTRNIDTGFRPHKHQLEFSRNWKQFNELICTRRWGKTTFIVNTFITCAAACQRKGLPPRFAYIAPVKDQARELTWPFFQMYLAPLIQVGMAKIDNSDMSIIFPSNGAVIKLYGTDKNGAEPLRGKYLDGVAMDEVDSMPEYVWSEIVRPTLADFRGWALKCGTVKGHGNLYRDWKKYQADPEWNISRYPLSLCWQDLPAYNEDEVRRIKAEYSDRWSVYLREYECDFDADCDDILIPGAMVTAAVERQTTLKEDDYDFAPKVLGVDVARYGGDCSCLVRRQGKKVWEPEIISGANNMEIGDRVAYMNKVHGFDAIFVDSGGGSGPIDYLVHKLGLRNVQEVPFGSRSPNKRYRDKRTQMYFDLRDWLSQGGALPNHKRLLDELSVPHYHFQGDQFIMDSKDDIRKELKRSPDVADALALTFAADVYKQSERQQWVDNNIITTMSGSTQYDPLARLNQSQRSRRRY